MVQITEKVIWTVCPQGLAPNGDRLVSVHVAPRLSVTPNSGPANSGHVSDLKTWSDWPAEVAKCAFRIDVYAGTSVIPTQSSIPAKVTSVAQSDVWRALMALQTPINDYVFKDLRSALILSYPVAELQAVILDLYTRLGLSSGEELPTSTDIIRLGWPGVLPYTKPRPPKPNRDGGTPQKDPVLPNTKARINTLRKAGQQALATQTVEGLFKHFELFHTPLLAEKMHGYTKKPNDPRESTKWPGYARPDLISPEELAERTDVHKIVAAIGNYAELSRLCGLVIDLTLPKAALPDGDCRLSLAAPRPGDRDIRPITACTVNAEDFSARAQGPGLVANRFLDLQQKGLDLIQMDVDGAAHKALGLGTSLPRMAVTQVSDTADAGITEPVTTTPSLRTAGLMLAQAGRYRKVGEKADRFGKMNDKLSTGIGDLYAEDLLRGYRVDVRDVTRGPQWRSLCWRDIDYTFMNGAVLSPQTLTQRKWKLAGSKVTGTTLTAEEGVIGTSLTSSPDGSIKDAYKLHEGLFVWRGWSLCAPEPFLSLIDEALPVPANASVAQQHAAMIGRSEGEVPPKMPLGTAFHVARDPLTNAGSLPVLRFGHDYQVRVRTVDIAGGSARHASTMAGAAASAIVPYLRFEPVEAPVVTLVSKNPKPKIIPGQETISPPDRLNWEDVEIPLQGESMTRMALRTYDNIWSARNATVTRRNAAPPRVTQRFAEAHGVIDGAAGTPAPDRFRVLALQDRGFDDTHVPPADLIAPPSADAAKGEMTRYSVSEKDFTLPYLPDPMAVYMVAQLKVLGQAKWTTQVIPLYEDVDKLVPKNWPHALPVLIEGQEGFPAFTFDAGSRTLKVPMPKACRHILRLSCVMSDYGIQQMALWRSMMTMAVTPQEKKRLDVQLGRIKRGRHWMFTPWREIELVHATQRPTVVPEITKIVQTREARHLETVINSLTATVSSPSTGRLDLNASWQEPEDNPVEIDVKSNPVTRTHKAAVAQKVLMREDAPAGQYTMTNIKHAFTDTRYRRVRYQLQGVSRFREFFEGDKTQADYNIRNRPELMTETSHEYTEWVRNAASPPAPEVLYVIPAFGWLHHKDRPATRRTGAIRVYLDRPWMVSGFNEMLAVIVPDPDDADAKGDAAPNQPFVTQWGRDPATLSKDIASNSPKASAFKLSKTQGPIHAPGTGFDPKEGSDLPAPSQSDGSAGDFKTRKLKVPGQNPDRLFAIAPHQTGFDTDRQLWYADIAVTLPKGSYYPFLRLAVARYQPLSVEGCHLSAVVTCDFMQISPDRIAVVVPLRDEAGHFKIFVYGDEGKVRDGINLVPFGKVNIQVQVRDAGSDPVLGWRDAPAGNRRRVQPGGIGTSVEVLENRPGSAINQNTLAARIATETAAELAAQSPAPVQAKPAGNGLPGLGGATVDPGTFQNNTPVAQLPGMEPAGPTLIFDDRFEAATAPAGGERRLLITEVETYLDSRGKPVERVVYAETIVF